MKHKKKIKKLDKYLTDQKNPGQLKMKDEWFYVYNYLTNKRYKCDQFDGLLACLKSFSTS